MHWIFRDRLKNGLGFLGFAAMFFVLWLMAQPSKEITKQGIPGIARVAGLDLIERRRYDDYYLVQLLYREKNGASHQPNVRLYPHEVKWRNLKLGQPTPIRYVPGTEIYAVGDGSLTSEEKMTILVFIVFGSLCLLLALITFFWPVN